MRKRILIANEDMSAQLILLDVLEINSRDAQIERALSRQNFWNKIIVSETDAPWCTVFVSSEYINDDPDAFIDRLKAENPDVLDKIVVTGTRGEFETLGEAAKSLPFLSIPFSLDEFETVIKDV